MVFNRRAKSLAGSTQLPDSAFIATRRTKCGRGLAPDCSMSVNP
ncbi:hypothetical protein C4K01_1783 [Pseudomonas synxantha]|nr:hypothetical protein C4K01_1783 [Pseudomonas synxantha]